MENLKKYVRSHVNHIFLFMVTAILCVMSGIVFHHWPVRGSGQYAGGIDFLVLDLAGAVSGR